MTFASDTCNWLLRAVLTCAALAGLANANAQPSGQTAWDTPSIVASGVLRVAITEFDLVPFHRKRADGSVEGPEIELARKLAGALKVRLEIVGDASSFDGVVDAVARGRADIGISKLSQTYGRLMRVRFSQPYLTLRHGLLFDRAAVASLAGGHSPESVLRAFPGRIGVIAGSAYVDFARQNFPSARVIELPGWSDAVDALKRRQLDAIYRDEFEIRNVLKLNPALNVRYGTAVMTDQLAFLSIAVCDSCTKLLDIVNYHLAGTRGAFTLDKLLATGPNN